MGLVLNLAQAFGEDDCPIDLLSNKLGGCRRNLEQLLILVTTNGCKQVRQTMAIWLRSQTIL